MQRVRVGFQSLEPTVWRVIEEATGLPAYRWTSRDMHAPDGVPIDHGGFGDGEFFSAWFLAAGVNYERALAGELEGVTTKDIERERRRAEHWEVSKGSRPTAVELDAFGLDAFERRKVVPKEERHRFRLEAARRFALAL